MDHSIPDEDNNKVNEPGASYSPSQRKKLQIYKSFEEAAEDEAAQVAKQPPLERIRETVALILRVYGVTQEQLNKQKKKLHIKIIRYGDMTPF